MKNVIVEHPLASFFVLAFAITWLAFIPFYYAGGEAIAWFTFGPFIAAVIVCLMVGGWPRLRELLASIVRWRVGWIWYAVAIGFPVLVQLVAAWLNPLFGSGPANWSAVPAAAQIAVTVAILLVFSGPLGEEPGWRGFAVPAMLKNHGALLVSLVFGVIWAAWHLPLALLGELSVYGTVHAVIAAVVFTWAWQNTGSVLIAILMHAAHQNGVRFVGRVFTGEDALQHQWITVALWLLAAVAIVAVYGTKSFRRAAGASTERASSPA